MLDIKKKYLSPHKGFSCAYRLLHGGESCSQHIKILIAEQGLIATLKTARIRFKACGEAYLILKTNMNHRVKRQRKKSSNINNNCCHMGMEESICCGAEACVDFSLDTLDCSGADCISGDCF